MTTINTGWLKNNDGEKFAPKTLASQVLTKDGVSIEKKVEESKEYVDDEIDEFSKNVAFMNSNNNEDVENPDVEMNGVVVDSALSENSTNPVQNRVITKEFKKVFGDIEYLGKELELIETITIEENGVKSIERTQEPDGTPYNFKKVMVFVHHPIAENNGRTAFKFYNTQNTSDYVVSHGQSLETTRANDSVFYMESINGHLFSFSIVCNENAARFETVNIATSPSAVRRTLKMDSVTFLNYISLNGYTLPIGTTMDIYAIRA